MAEAKAAPTTTVILSEHQNAARELARAQAELREKGIVLDRTVPGGSFLGTDGKLHDSEGNPIDDAKAAAKK